MLHYFLMGLFIGLGLLIPAIIFVIVKEICILSRMVSIENLLAAGMRKEFRERANKHDGAKEKNNVKHAKKVKMGFM